MWENMRRRLAFAVAAAARKRISNISLSLSFSLFPQKFSISSHDEGAKASWVSSLSPHLLRSIYHCPFFDTERKRGEGDEERKIIPIIIVFFCQKSPPSFQ